MLFIGVECLKCGVFRRGFMGQDSISNKLDKIIDIKKHIGTLLQMTAKTKDQVYRFSEGTKVSESRLFSVTIIECVMLVLTTLWQLYFLRKLLHSSRVL